MYDNTHPPRLLFETPGLLQGCYGVEATLQSSLECYYNQTCIDTLHFNINPNMTINVLALNFTRIQNGFTTTTPLYQFIEQMLVETWSNTSSHAAFFHHCQPLTCSYSYVGKNNLVVIITTIIGLIGGLNFILKLVIPHVTDLVRRWQRRNIQQHPIIQGKRLFIVSPITRCVFAFYLPTEAYSQKLYQFIIHKKRFLIEFNLFSSPLSPLANAHDEIRGQHIATRLYLICLIVPLIILAVYTSEVAVINTVTIHSPSYDTYLTLYQKYPQILSCPCTSISNRYDQFISLRVARYHHVCQSVFVTSTWTQPIFEALRYYRVQFGDFRLQGTTLFQGLASFCSATQQIINDELTVFHAQRLVTTTVMPLNVFTTKLNFAMESLITSTSRLFMRTLLLIRETTQSNKLFSIFSTNTLLTRRYRSDQTMDIIPLYISFSMNASSVCSCLEKPTCIAPTYILTEAGLFPVNILFTIPGLQTSCFILESLLKSTLTCFFNQSCIDQIRLYLTRSAITSNIPPLNASLLTVFTPQSTIGDIVAQLMVEEWINTTSHQSYYNRCHAVDCTYSYVGKNNWLIILTKVIGTMSGLSAVLKIFAPRVAQIVQWITRNHRMIRPSFVE